MNSKTLMDMKAMGYREFITDEIPVKFTLLTDDKSSSAGWNYRVSCIGSVANKIYASGRVIPLEIQSKGINDAIQSGRQMTGFLDHPKDYVRGRLEDLAAVVPKFHLNETGETILDEVKILPTQKGKLLKTLIDSGVDIGVSQRALGKESVRKWRDQVVMLVEDIQEILGWDFCHLDNANAGKVTRVSPITDSILDEIRKAPLVEETTEVNEMANKTNKPEVPEVTITDVNEPKETGKEPEVSDLVKANQALVDKMDKLIGTIEDGLKSAIRAENANSDLADKVWQALRLTRSEIDKIVTDDKLTADAKNTKLTAIGNELKDIFNMIASDLIDANKVVDSKGEAPAETVEDTKPEGEVAEEVSGEASKEAKPAEGSPAVEEVADTKQVEKPVEAPAVSEEPKPKPEPVSDKRVEETVVLMDSIDQLKNSVQGVLQSAKMQKVLEDTVAGLEIGDGYKKSILDSLRKRNFQTEDEVKTAIEDSVTLVKQGAAEERLKQEGYKAEGVQVMDEIKVVPNELNGVKVLTDSLVGTGQFRSQHGVKVEKIVMPEDPVLRNLLKVFDQRWGAHLAQEGKFILDATTTVDFQTPVTISRIILTEVYANFIVPQITDFGSMDNDRDTIPITKWIRETGSARTYKPTKLQIANLKPGELQPMSRGKLVTSWYPIDAVARKLETVLSEEFITRAKRKPNITGVAQALTNLVDDIRRALQQEVFLNMLGAAMEYNAITLNFSDTGDGSASLYTVTSGGSISMGTDLAVLVNSEACGLYGYDSTTENSQGLYYIPNFAYGTVQFVNASGVPTAPTSTHTISVVGKEVVNEVRFDLNDLGTQEWDAFMSKLLFKVEDQIAAHSQDRGYEPNMVLSSLTSGNWLQQAKAYTPLNKRKGYDQVQPIKEGNYGITAGLPHWASKVFPNEFILITDDKATIFRQYEPLHLQGPVEARDADGRLIAGKEYYAYQEDALTTPIQDKLSLVTVVNTGS